LQESGCQHADTPGTLDQTIFREAGTMSKTDYIFFQYTFPYNTLAVNDTDSAPTIEDPRVARLLLVLRLIQRSAGPLSELPKAELTEILSSAVPLCGFANPIEIAEVTGTVLEALDIRERLM
jgi:hypothetical protein